MTVSHSPMTIRNDSRIRIPHLGWVRMRESLRFVGKIMSATISRRADKWFVSVTVEIPKKSVPTANDNQVAVGVDLGLSSFARLSTGEEISGPKPYKSLLQRVKRLARGLSRKQAKSTNRGKARLKLARLHARIANIRHNALHQLTTHLTKHYAIIGIEDLNIKGMMQNRRLSRSVADIGMHEFRRQLMYKAEMKNKKVVIADRWFASSKTCSQCGYKLTSLTLSTREWTCPTCQTYHHRDINAAKNLEKMAVSSTVSACGASSDGIIANAVISHGVLKQESNVKVNYG